MDETYYHVRVILYDKPALYDAVRDCFVGDLDEILLLMTLIDPKDDKSINDDKFILTEHQRDQLKNSPNETCTILCCSRQIMLYAHNCITRTVLHKILSGENP